MSDLLDRLSNLSPNRLALLVMDLQAKLDEAEQRETAPIAIIGGACRLPGADSLEAFWQLLEAEIDTVGEIPADRFDVDALFDPDTEASGRIASRWGGFLDHIDQFDAALFGIAPKEAAGIDPQQRLLLETSWEALELAGYAPDGLRGSNVGVFAGLCNSDYGQMLLGGDRSLVDAYTATGSAHSVAAGRISYVLGLQGPSIAIDTACSSSLVAVHLAIQSLRNGECQMALAGGSNVILSPDTTIALSRARMMAPDGRCKAFDASADGFVRSEGCGVVVLKRLADALADNDPILAVIRGSAVNQDGRSNGLTAPNGPSQEAVLRAALADARLSPDSVDYIEAHGTGTSLGDPIEAHALGAVFGQRTATPLLVGSVKTNLGHLEAAAGIAGLLKVVLMLRHGQIPASLHFSHPSPHIAWERLPLEVPVALRAWPETAGSKVAGVSSFGFSGTNAHILLEAAPDRVRADAELERPWHAIKLTASSDEALREYAGQLERVLAAPDAPALADFAHTLNVARSDLARRAVVTASDTEEARAGLVALASGDLSEHLITGTAGQRPPMIAFLFTGQGGQYPGMGKELYAATPAFRDALDRCAALLEPLLDRALLDLLFAAPDSPEAALLDETRYTQPALFAFEYALAELWQSWGVRPAAVAGHSLGEYVAACVAGVLELEDALRLVVARGRLMGSLPAGGGMAAVFASESDVNELLGDLANEISIAAINGPASVVLSGAADLLEVAAERLRTAGIEARVLAIPLAAHSPMVEPILDAFEREAQTAAYGPPQLELVSGLTGKLISSREIDAHYWRRQLREPVRYSSCVDALADAGYTAFVEIGPHPTLLGMAKQFLPDSVLGAPSLRRGHDAWETMLNSLGALYVVGVPIDWKALDRPYCPRRIELPTYPFQRERYWHVALSAGQRRRNRRGAAPADLLGQRILSPAMPSDVFETVLAADQPAFLADHRIHGVVTLASPVYLEMLRDAGQTVFGTRFAVSDLQIHEALILPDDGERIIQTVLTRAGSGADGQIYSRLDDDSHWRLHASARLDALVDTAAREAVDIDVIRGRCFETLDASSYYAGMAAMGLEFGASFRGLREIYRCDGEALGLMEQPDVISRDAATFGIHPALLDACFHLLGAPLPADLRERTYLMIAIDEFRLHRPAPARLWTHAQLREIPDADGETFGADMRLYDQDGYLIAEAIGLHLKLATPEALARIVRKQASDLLYEVSWLPTPITDAVANPLPAPTTVAASARDALRPLANQHGLEVYDKLLPALDRLTTSYIVEALARLGVSFVCGSSFNADVLVQDLGIQPRYQRLLNRLLTILSEDGILATSSDIWRVIREPEMDVDLCSAMTILGERFPDASAEISLTAQCGARLADVLLGEVDPLHLLFPYGSLNHLEQLYSKSPFARVFNDLVAEGLTSALAGWQGEGPIRVLEIGAGTGATTRAALGALPATGVEYWFTDVSPLFLERAAAQFSGDNRLRYKLFDLEQDPAEQGIPPGGFDLVIAANVVHATSDVTRSLDHARKLLTAGGLLLLLEGTRPQRWVDLTFGLTEGWWSFTDIDLRPDYPLVDRNVWCELLIECGFNEPSTIGCDPDEPVDQTLIIAGAPSLSPTQPVDWLLVTDSDGLGLALAERIRERGETVALETSTASLSNWLENRAENAEPARIVYLAGLDAPGTDAEAEIQLAAATEMSAAVVDIVKLLSERSIAASLWIVTRGAQFVFEPPTAPLQATLWGLGRVIALEHPDIWGGLIDLDPVEQPDDSAARLLTTLDASDGEDQLALRDGQRLAARLIRTESLPDVPTAIDANASYLIVGGTGGLGLKVARWLAESGARHITITGRTALPLRQHWNNGVEGRAARQVEAILAIEALGATVELVKADVADRAQMSALFSRFGTDQPPLRGIVHAAAHLGAFPLIELPESELAAMLRPKLAGTLLLHELSRELDLDFFVGFSSTTALWGSSRLAHYAAANAFLDAFAHWRNSVGLPALSINWGTWDEMRVASEDERELVAGFGLNPLPSDVALSTLGDLLGSSRAQVAVAAVDWQRLKPAYEARRERPFLALVGGQADDRNRTPRTPSSQDPKSNLISSLESVRAESRRDIVAGFVQEEVARTLGMETGRAIDPQQGLFQLGLDSLMAVDLKGRLEAGLGKNLPATLIFNHPTIDALTTFLFDEIGTDVTTAPNGDAGNHVSATAPLEMETQGFDELSEDELELLLAQRLARL